MGEGKYIYPIGLMCPRCGEEFTLLIDLENGELELIYYCDCLTVTLTDGRELEYKASVA